MERAARTPVWARQTRGGGRGPQPSLSVDRIVESAVALADTEGVDAVSMRRVASELGVGTMSLYRYVETKDDLLDLMTDQVMGEALTTPDDPALGWRFRLRALALRYRQVMLRHPGRCRSPRPARRSAPTSCGTPSGCSPPWTDSG
ncbi:TetR/AcrR family transcriptional regulator [Streptacidiphilus monticola]